MTDGAVARARAFLRQAACREHAATVLDKAVLLTSELVTNGIRHGAPPIIVKVHCDGPGGYENLIVSVTDHETTLLQKRSPDGRSEGGRGLNLVDYFSDSWGVEHQGRGQVRLVQARQRIARSWPPDRQHWFQPEQLTVRHRLSMYSQMVCDAATPPRCCPPPPARGGKSLTLLRLKGTDTTAALLYLVRELDVATAPS